MLIFATLGIAIVAIGAWSTIHGQNGFQEVVKMLRGEPAFVVADSTNEQPDGQGEPTADPTEPSGASGTAGGGARAK